VRRDLQPVVALCCPLRITAAARPPSPLSRSSIG
jgi:hypothetical protein